MNRRKRRGFSLVEVNIAILMIGLGMLVLFGLFPSGLREGENSITDTHCALFAKTVMEGLRAKAESMTWEEWQDLDNFELTSTDLGNIAWGSGVPIGHTTSVSGEVLFPPTSDPDDLSNRIRYMMTVSGAGTDRVRSVDLWVWSGKYATQNATRFKQLSEWYFSRFYYSGTE